jgi:hypothetical protein
MLKERIPSTVEAADPAEVVFLAECTDEDWDRILRYCAHRRFAAGEILIREGQVDRTLMILTSGTLEADHNRRERRACRSRSDRVFGPPRTPAIMNRQ